MSTLVVHPNMCEGQPAEYLDAVIDEKRLKLYEEQLNETILLYKQQRQRVCFGVLDNNESISK